ncbi:MAG: hypothetical protein U0Q55_21910 [Vicinamibacterales bacterium]
MRRLSRVVVLPLLAALLGIAVVPPPGSGSIRAFDPDRVADLELAMWRAYYAKQRARLFALLVQTLREQYHFSYLTATTTGFHLAKAAATFGDASRNYERVLPDLEAAFASVAAHSSAPFDPRRAAAAELSWWVARRTPGENAPEQVGALMADMYAVVYSAPRADVLEAAVLRARAGALRDAAAAHPDWETIRVLLQESYRQLRASLSTSTSHRGDE